MMRKSSKWLVRTVLYLSVVSGLAAQTGNRTEIEQHYAKAQEALHSNQNAVAENEFREILHLDPKNASAHANLGVIAYTEKDYPRASQEFRAALKLQPKLWNAEAFLGMSELRQALRAIAQPLLEESFAHLQDDHLKSQVGMDIISLDYQSGDPNRAVDVLQALLRIRPVTPAVLYIAYRTYSDLAARALSNLAETAPDSPQMHQILAQASASQDDFAGAIAQYRKALEANAQLPEIHYELGQMILANSKAEPARAEAEKEFNLSLAGDPSNAYDEYTLGEIAWLRSKPENALAHYSRALDFEPAFVDAHIAAGKALTLLGRPGEALNELQKAVGIDSRNEVAHYRLAQAYRKMGRIQDADREEAAFRKLRDSHEPVRALFQQVQERMIMHQTVDSNEPK
jgi:tetratricopeptide (TPR) repeat protein